MTPKFQPPPDYTTREVEAIERVSGCPFYGASLVHVGRFGQAGWQQLERQGVSNRCALITGAHSPCWMEVGEQRSPDWAQCPRNPEYNALTLGHEADGRINACSRHLQRLTRMRVAGVPL